MKAIKPFLLSVAVSISLVVSGCIGTGTEADDLLGLAKTTPVEVPQGLQITFSTPSASGSRVGYQITAGGSCTLPGAIVRIDGPQKQTLALTACQAGGTWTADLNFATIPTLGSVTVSAYLVSGTASSAAATKVFIKDNIDCDSATARADTYANYSTGGDGSTTPYIVCNAAQFNNIRLNLTSNFSIKNDIDFKGAGLTTIGGVYLGTLSGNGFTVKNLTVSSPGSNQVGIFSYFGNGTVVQDLALQGISVTGNAIIGGLVGRTSTNSTITISNVSIGPSSTTTSSVTGLTGGAAGFLGYLDNNSTLNLTNVTFEGTVLGVGNSGGILGYSHASAAGASFSNVSTAGTITSTAGNVGGLVGNSAFTNMSMSNVSSTMAINMSGTAQNAGGLIGVNNGGTISNCSYAGNMAVFGSYAGGLVGQFVGTAISDCSASPVIVGDTTNGSISYVGGLFGYNNGNTSITNSSATVDIAITGTNIAQYVGGLVGRFRGPTVSNVSASGTVSVNTGDGTTTGGSYTGGAFGHVIAGSGETIDIASAASSASVSVVSSVNAVYTGGFAGYVQASDAAASAAIVNLTNVRASGNVSSSNQYVGGLVAYSYAGREGSVVNYTNVSASGSVTASQQGTGRTVSYVGGLIGSASTRNNGGDTNPSAGNDFTGASATGAVTAQGAYVGGLIGYLYAGRSGSAGSVNTLTNSYATGAVTASNINLAPQFVGGLIGRAYSESLLSTINISNSHATGAVTNDGTNYTGGLIGDSVVIGTGSTTVSASYATGDVKTVVTVAATADTAIGGLIGRTNATGATVETSYSTGNVTVELQGAGTVTSAYAGGLVGYALGPIDASYALGSVTAVCTSGCQYVGGLAGRTNANVTNSFAAGNVIGGISVGGFSGYHRTGVITDSFSMGDVTALQYGGGFVGEFSGAGSAGALSRIYSIGGVTRASGSSQTNRFGPIVGYCLTDSWVSNGFYNSTTGLVDAAITTPETNCNSGRGLTAAQMTNSANFTGFDFVGTLNSSWRYSSTFLIPSTSTVYPYPVQYWFTL